jgi:uncharacterized delta-60 repeat protein
MKKLRSHRKNLLGRHSVRGNIPRNACATIRHASAMRCFAHVEAMEPRMLLSGSISGTVFADTNHDGVMDNGEKGLAGVTVYMDPNYNHKLDAGEQSVVTDANGNYDFTNPPADPEILRVILPSGAQQTFPANGIGQYVGKNTGANLTGINFGLYTPGVVAPASLTGTISGLGGGISLYVDLKNSGSFVAGDPYGTTDFRGEFAISGIPAGTYNLRALLPAGDTAAAVSVTLAAGQTLSGVNVKITAPPSPNGFLAGTVYFDANQDGNQNDGEVGVAGITVYIDAHYNHKLEPGDETAVTNALGNYYFPQPPADPEIVRIVLPSGYNQTYPQNGAGEYVGKTYGQYFSNLSFGISNYIVNNATVTGVVYNDINKDQMQDDGEPGVPNVQVFLDLTGTGKFNRADPTSTTNAQGQFDLEPIPPGTYNMYEILPAGYTQFTPGGGGPIPVSIFSGQTLASQNFGVIGALAGTPGQQDASYGSGGGFIPTFPAPQQSNTSVAILPLSNGESIFVGSASPPEQEPPIPGTDDFALARYTAAGTLDTTYGTNGVVLTGFPQGDVMPTAAVMQPDGKVVVVGVDSSNTDILLARYTTSGALDPTFGKNGIVVESPGYTYVSASAISIDSSGRIVVAGAEFSSNTIVEVILLRFLSNGTLDSTFGKGGVDTFASGPLFNSVFNAPATTANSIAIESDQKIVIGGQTASGNFFAARLTTAGALDTSFGTGGVATVNFGENSGAAPIAFVAGGKILLGGNATNASAVGSFALARLNTNGTLDTSFGTNGKTTTAFAGETGVSTAMTVQSNGKIVLVGGESVVNEGDIAMVIARYSANGFLDPTFNGTGEVPYNHETSNINFINESAAAVAIQPDGKILVAGTQGEGGPGGSSSNAIINRFFGDPTTAIPETISGAVFNDTNGDGIQDDGEKGLAGITVYLDPNYNHKLDPSEESVVTDANGDFTFTNLPADPEILRVILPSGYEQTFPANGAGDYVGQNTGQTLIDEDFGIKLT